MSTVQAVRIPSAQVGRGELQARHRLVSKATYRQGKEPRCVEDPLGAVADLLIAGVGRRQRMGEPLLRVLGRVDGDPGGLV